VREAFSVPAGAVPRPASGKPVFVSRRIRLLIPDLALFTSVIVLLYCLFLFQGYQKLFRDSDAGWHIRNGEKILTARELPRTDTYSFTRQGQPWIAWEWGSDLIMGSVHASAGLAGVAVLFATAIAAGVWLWFRLNWAANGDFLLACALASPLLSTCNIHWLARPHVFSWLFLLGTMLYAEKLSRNERLPLWLAFAGGALWANLHASFFFGPLILAIYAAGHALGARIWQIEPAPEWRLARALALAAGAAALGSLVNPHGWRLHRHILAYLTDSELLHRVGEFQTFDFQSGGSFQIMLAVGISALGGAAALAHRRMAHFLLSALLVAAALRSARALPVLALLVLPLANGAVTEVLGACDSLRPGLRQAIQEFFGYSARLRTIDARFSGLALAPFIVLAVALLPHPEACFPADQFPVAAAAEVAKLPPSARLLAPDKFGGYLIYRFAGERKVFFDGRSDLYGARFLKDYSRLVQVRPGWRQQLEQYRFTHALLPNDYSLIPALEQVGWRRVYRDTTATLLAGPGTTRGEHG
jgi:hypothetical protein